LPATRALTVLVTNDDGVRAPGIDAIVQALAKEPRLTVRVVAPVTNQSGTGEKTTPGTVTYNIAATLSGYPAIAVAGTPADAANVAFTQLQLKPNVLISGVNALQNLGPLVDVSGTVGAARVGARHGVPALAVSSGAGSRFDFATAARYAIDWLRAERATLPATPSSLPASVVSLNVPSCSAGRVRGELKLPEQTELGAGESALGTSDCTSTAKPTTEVAAFTAGFATLVTLPLNPG
jgi:5'-nucleotidase